MANYSRGWAGIISQPEDTPAPDWSDLQHATVSDNNRATCTLPSSTDAEWLVATNFSWARAVPSGATVVGIMVFVEGFHDPGGDAPAPMSVHLEDARLVIGGTIQSGGPATGLGRPLGRGTSPEQYELIAGSESDLWGQTPTQAQATASNFGVALKFRALGPQGEQTVAHVDSIRLLIWWTKTPACVITPVTTISGGQAPFQFIAHALNSDWGDALPQEVTFKWTVTGPTGWSQTVRDPRRGGWSSATRNLATLWGKCPHWLFDVPGEYTVNCTMYRTHTDGTFLTTAATAVTVTVGVSTRPVYYVSSQGNNTTGTSWTNAWQTLGKAALDAPKTGAEIVVADDDTITESDLAHFSTFQNLWIHRSGVGTDPPTIRHALDEFHTRFTSCTLTVIQGLHFEYIDNGDRPVAISAWNNTFLCLADCSHDGCDAFCEFDTVAGTFQEGVFLLRCDGTDHRRYMLYVGGDFARYYAAIGGRWDTSRDEDAEGQIRVNDAFKRADAGSGFLMAFVHTSSSGPLMKPYDSCRHGWSEQDVYANRFDELGDFNLASNGENDRQSWEINSRFEANDMDFGGEMPWGERAHYVLFASNYVRLAASREIGDAGVSISYRIYLNTLVAASTNDDMHFWRTKASGTLHDGLNHLLVGNLWLTELVPGSTTPTTWTGRYWRNDVNRSMGASFSYNVYNDDGDPTERWAELDVDLDLAGWNLLGITSNEIFVANLHGGGTLPLETNSWALPTSFSATRHVPPNVIRGVFFDYRLIMRDPSVSSGTWPAGCTGDEP